MFFNIYIITLSITLGSILTLGIFVAPVIFNATDYIAMEISRIDSGTLMSEIFIKFNYLLIINAILSLIYEMRVREKINVIISIAIAFLSFAFAFIFTPYIVDSAKSNRISDDFEIYHKLSEWDFKIVAILLFVLIFRNLREKIDKNQKS